MDRGYAKFGLFNKIVSAKSSYIYRVRDNSACDVLQSNELSQEAVEAGVINDPVVRFGSHSKKSRQGPDHKIRLVCVRFTRHTSRGE